MKTQEPLNPFKENLISYFSERERTFSLPLSVFKEKLNNNTQLQERLNLFSRYKEVLVYSTYRGEFKSNISHNTLISFCYPLHVKEIEKEYLEVNFLFKFLDELLQLAQKETVIETLSELYHYLNEEEREKFFSSSKGEELSPSILDYFNTYLYFLFAFKKDILFKEDMDKSLFTLFFEGSITSSLKETLDEMDITFSKESLEDKVERVILHFKGEHAEYALTFDSINKVNFLGRDYQLLKVFTQVNLEREESGDELALFKDSIIAIPLFKEEGEKDDIISIASFYKENIYNNPLYSPKPTLLPERRDFLNKRLLFSNLTVDYKDYLKKYSKVSSRFQPTFLEEIKRDEEENRLFAKIFIERLWECLSLNCNKEDILTLPQKYLNHLNSYSPSSEALRDNDLLCKLFYQNSSCLGRAFVNYINKLSFIGERALKDLLEINEGLYPKKTETRIDQEAFLSRDFGLDFRLVGIDIHTGTTELLEKNDLKVVFTFKDYNYHPLLSSFNNKLLLIGETFKVSIEESKNDRGDENYHTSKLSFSGGLAIKNNPYVCDIVKVNALFTRNVK